MPKPRPGTCTINGDINVPGLKNIGSVISGGRGFNIRVSGMEFKCECSDEYRQDVFTTELYVAK